MRIPSQYSPLRELDRMERDLEGFWESPWWGATPLDVYVEGDSLVAETSLPAFTKDEVKVSTDEGALEISAEHQEQHEAATRRRYFLRESSNRFFRRASLPTGALADKAQASFKNGLLKVTMPFVPQKEAKRVGIK